MVNSQFENYVKDTKALIKQRRHCMKQGIWVGLLTTFLNTWVLSHFWENPDVISKSTKLLSSVGFSITFLGIMIFMCFYLRIDNRKDYYLLAGKYNIFFLGSRLIFLGCIVSIVFVTLALVKHSLNL